MKHGHFYREPVSASDMHVGHVYHMYFLELISYRRVVLASALPGTYIIEVKY